MHLILGSERALFARYIVEAELNVDDFEITKEEDAPRGQRKGQLGGRWDKNKCAADEKPGGDGAVIVVYDVAHGRWP